MLTNVLIQVHVAAHGDDDDADDDDHDGDEDAIDDAVSDEPGEIKKILYNKSKNLETSSGNGFTIFWLIRAARPKFH